MFAQKSRLLATAILVAALTFPTAVDAHAGSGSGHGGGGIGGGMGHGGMGHGHGSHHGWGGWGWSWGVPWGWNSWDYPVYWDGGNNAAYQQGYYAALQQAQLAAQQ